VNSNREERREPLSSPLSFSREKRGKKRGSLTFAFALAHPGSPKRREEAYRAAV